MSPNWYGVVTLLLLVSAASAQERPCPGYSNKPALLEFLRGHRSNSIEADPTCVRRAFAALSHDTSYVKALVELLDFERDYSRDEKLLSRSSQYPAIGALANSEAVPLLIKAIEENDNEVARTNAADAVSLVYGNCIQTAVSLMEKEAIKPQTYSREQYRLRQAERYVREHAGSQACEKETQVKKYED